MNADGTAPVELAAADGGLTQDLWPDWSPDGTRIAYTREGDTTGDDIWVLDLAPDVGATPLVTDPALDFQPTWSPDGARIAFSSTRAGGGDIFVVSSAGLTPPVNLTNRPEIESDPSWSPSGARIAYTAFLPAGPRVFHMRTDGTDRFTLRDGLGPAWSVVPLRFTPGAGPGAQQAVLAGIASQDGGPTGSPLDGIVNCQRAMRADQQGRLQVCDAVNPVVARTTQVAVATVTPEKPAKAAAKRRKRKKVTVGRGSTVVPEGQTRPVTITLTARGKKLLASRKKLPLEVQIEVEGTDGRSAAMKTPVSAAPAKPRKPPRKRSG